MTFAWRPGSQYDVGLTPEYCGKRSPEQSELWEGKPSKPYLLRAFQPYSGCTKSFPKVLSAKRFQATKAMRAKRAVTVPLQPYFGFHWDVAATRGADSVLASDCPRTFWSSFNKERMSHLCDSTVAGPTARRDNVLASKCEYPRFRYPPFN